MLAELDDALEGRAGVLPVWVCAYWRSSEGHEAQLEIRVGAETNEWATVPLSNDSAEWSWTLEPAWLECGLSPQLGKNARIYLRSSDPAGTAEIRNVVVVYRPSR
ncbi:MAG: hypothetical protein HC927_09310 [Deltaproteobacteria bacterium]|nr:hypothetical protein [Deltaproteobacteria bacterium]